MLKKLNKKKKAVLFMCLIFLALSMLLPGCAREKGKDLLQENPQENSHGIVNEDTNENGGKEKEETEKEETEKEEQDTQHSVAGISLGDDKNVVEQKLGREYEAEELEEAGHFPENIYFWTYPDQTVVCIGKESGKVLEIHTTAEGAETNLGIKIGDSAEKVLSVYRAKYKEPESIHGYGILWGVFKVENGAAIILDFNEEDGIVNPEGIQPHETLKRIILTYPSQLDEDF